MPSQKLERTAYYLPSPPNVLRGGNGSDPTMLRESAMDMDSYARPLHAVHGSCLHGWGVAIGLRAFVNPATQELTVMPGAAVDHVGRTISLAEGGAAEVGPT